MNNTIDFNDYLFIGETWLNIKGEKGIVDPQINVKLTRYLKNKFLIFLTFYTDNGYDNYNDDYSGMIEFTFNLDNYLIDSNGSNK